AGAAAVMRSIGWWRSRSPSGSRKGRRWSRVTRTPSAPSTSGTTSSSGTGRMPAVSSASEPGVEPGALHDLLEAVEGARAPVCSGRPRHDDAQGAEDDRDADDLRGEDGFGEEGRSGHH